MLDPIFSPPSILVKAIKPVAELTGLSTLPFHFHEVIFGLICYHVIYKIISPMVSARVFPKLYPHLSLRTTINWNVHFTSFIQSSFITAFALFVIVYDEERKSMGWAGRIWGYTGAGGAVQGFAAGYFLWDLTVSTMHLSVLGWGSLAHAVSALLVTSLGFVSSCRFFFFQPENDTVASSSLMADLFAASFRKLLRLEFHPLRGLYSFPEYPLVLRQTQYDRHSYSAL